MKRLQSVFHNLVTDYYYVLMSRRHVRQAFNDGDRDGGALFWRLSIIRWRQWRRMNFRACMEVAA